MMQSSRCQSRHSSQSRSGLIGSASQARAAHHRRRGMGGAYCHPGAEHGQDGELASSPWSGGQREHLQTERRACDTLDAIEGLAEPALMEQAPGQPARATARQPARRSAVRQARRGATRREPHCFSRREPASRESGGCGAPVGAGTVCGRAAELERLCRQREQWRGVSSARPRRACSSCSPAVKTKSSPQPTHESATSVNERVGIGHPVRPATDADARVLARAVRSAGTA